MRQTHCCGATITLLKIMKISMLSFVNNMMKRHAVGVSRFSPNQKEK
jgi:hypothetical protein